MSDLVPNLRDVGGVPAAGGAVRTGVLLRSALPDVSDRAPDHVVWPPTLVIDLRSPGEVDQVHPLAFRSRQVVVLPLLSALKPDQGWPDTLADLYLAVLDEASHLLVDLVSHVAAEEQTTLVHCAAGKDRTGIAVALLLRLVGVSREHVIADYLRTVEAEAEIAARLGASTAPAHFFLVPVEAIEAVLDVWDAHPGGTAGWFTSVGGTSADIALLRQRLVG